MSKLIDKNWATRPWCVQHNEKYINGQCPYDILINFYEHMEELGSETDGSKVDMDRLDNIYQEAIKQFREVVPAPNQNQQFEAEK